MKQKLYCFVSLTICFLVFYSMRWLLLSQKKPTRINTQDRFEFSRELMELRATNSLLKAAVQDQSRKGFEYLWEFREVQETRVKVRLKDDPMSVFHEIKRQASQVSSHRLGDYMRDCNLASTEGKSGFMEKLLSRAKSSQCRAELLVTACMQEKRNLYPKVEVWPNYCSNVSSGTNWKLEETLLNAKRSLKIVFLLQLSGRSDRQFERLLKSIYCPHHAYLLHIDAGSNYLYSFAVQLSAQFSNVRVMKSRFNTLWGSSHLLLMQIAAFQEAFSYWPHFDYIINLSESDLPIRPLSELVTFLQWNRGDSFVSVNAMGKEYASKQGLHHTFYQCDGHLFRLQKREIPPGIRYTGGSDWFVLHRQFVDYVINPPVDDELVNDLVSYFAFTILPAETYFATLIDASKFCGVHKRTDLRYVSWDRKKGGCFCKEKSTVDWCGCSPLVIRNVTSKWFYHDNVLNNTVDENSRFFARKFDPVVSLSAINHLAEKLPQSFGNSSASDASWSSFWLNFFHADFDNTKSPLLLAANWLGNISMSKLQLKFPQDFSQLTHAASRGDHYFINDSYSGDVWTFRDTGSDRLLQTPYLQLYMLPRGKLDYFDDRYFHSSLQISANFDAKENISRSFNNRLTTLDTVWTIFAKFSDANVRQRLNQTFHVRLKRGVDTHVSKIVHPRVGDTYFVADFYLHPEKIKPRVWKAQVKNSAESIIATREFVVMGSRIDSASLKEASNFWLLSGYCVGGDWNQESVLPSFSSCESQPWSLYYPDRKSLSTQNRLVI